MIMYLSEYRSYLLEVLDICWIVFWAYDDEVIVHNVSSVYAETLFYKQSFGRLVVYQHQVDVPALAQQQRAPGADCHYANVDISFFLNFGIRYSSRPELSVEVVEAMVIKVFSVANVELTHA